MVIRLLFTFIIFFSFSNLWAREWRINAKDIYLEVEVDSNFNTILSEGESPNLQGHFCLRQIKSPKKCLKLSPDDLSHYEVKFYYPNITNEVTSLTSINVLDDRHEFEFTIPTLTKSDRPQFIAQIVNKGSKVDLHQKALIKIQKLKERLLARQTFWPFIGKKYVEKLFQVLEKIEARITTKVQGESALIAKRELALQVHNNLSESSAWVNATEEWQVEARIVLGNTFEGEQSWIDLAFTPFPSNDDEWKLQYYLNGALVKTKQVVDPSSLLQERIITPQLNPGEQELKIVMSRRAKFWFFDVWTKTFEKTYNFDTLPDTLAPLAENILPVGGKIVSKNYPMISFDLRDGLGRVDFSSIIASLESGDGSSINVKNKLNFQANGEILVPSVHGDQDGSSSYAVTGTLGSLLEGIYSLKFSGDDFAGNSLETIVWDLIIDRTSPTLAISQEVPAVTNTEILTLPIIVSDLTGIKLNVFVNGLPQLHRESPRGDLQENLEIALVEGVNFITIDVTDEAGNSSNISLAPITLDTTPPEIANINPGNGENVFTTTSLVIKGKSNELLQAVLVNGNPAIIKSDGKSFEYFTNSFAEGEFLYELKLIDLAGNISTSHHNIEIIFTILNKNLISITPSGEDDQLVIVGAAGAAKPGIEINAKSSFLNSEGTLANADGSFELILDFFETVAISGLDPLSGETESFSLAFSANTTLSGVIKDIDGKPLPGVTVTILSSGQSTLTDSAGSFQIPDPYSGVQKIVIDATTMSQELVGNERKFFQTIVAFNIGKTQLNVMPTVYLGALIRDGSQTLVQDNSEAIVTSPHAPGFEMRIPAGKAIFPGGNSSGEISVAEISSARLTISTPEYVTPETVFALEPSGLTFSEPVEVTLPNPNNFPPGLNVLIMSKNSSTGTWEVDGVAEVTENGSEIKTKEGLGIRHFSEIFAIPVMPTLTRMGNNDQSQASLADSAVTTSIDLPKYKTLNQDNPIKLIYSSSWANPVLFVKHVIDYVDKKVTTVPGQEVYKIDKTKFVIDTVNETWPELEQIKFSFESNNLITNTKSFTGLPNKSVLSYGVDVSNFETGLYPYTAHFEMQFANVTLSTRKILRERRYMNWMFRWSTDRDRWTEYHNYRSVFEDFIPQDLTGPLFVSNKKDSSIGKGWKLAGHQELLNIEGPRIAVEDGSGEVKVFSIDRVMETVFKDEAGIETATLSNFPDIYYLTTDSKVKHTSTDFPGSGSVVSSIPSYQGSLTSWTTDTYVNGKPVNCNLWGGSMSVKPTGGKFIRSSNNLLYLADNMNGILRLDGGYSFSYIAGGKGKSPGFIDVINFRSLYPNGTFVKAPATAVPCSGAPTIQGSLPKTGLNNGSLGMSEFNAPFDILEVGTSIFLVTDKGNNLLRLMNVNTNTVSTFAGNGTNFDSGDGGSALEAGIPKPQGLARFSASSFFVSNENGLIRKIDGNGVINHVAGKSIGNGGVYADVTSIEKVNFSNPTGLAFDKNKNILYVADTGHHRVVALNFNTDIAETIAGKGCSTGDPDRVLAIDAQLCSPTFLHLDDSGNLIVHDKGNKRIRKILMNTSSGTEIAFSSSVPDGEILKKLSDNTWLKIGRDTSSTYFREDGKISAIVLRDGFRQDFIYDVDRLIRISDSLGSNINLSYNPEGKLMQITDPSGRATKFNLLSNGELESVVFPDLSTKTFNYDPKGLLISEKDQTNLETNFEYNDLGRVTKITSPDGKFKEFNNKETLVTILDPSLESHVFVDYPFSSLGNGDSDINLDVTDEKGKVTRVVLGTSGKPEEIIFSDGTSTKYGYDEYGRLTKAVNQDLSYVTFAYNSFSEIIESFNSSTNSKWFRTYNDEGQLVYEKNPKGVVKTHSYDPVAGYLKSTVDLTNGITASFTYNNLGLPTLIQNNLGHQVVKQYDALGNLISITNAQSQTTSFSRDPFGNVQSKTSPTGAVTVYETDVMNRLTGITSPGGKRTSYSYNSKSQLASIKDPSGNLTTFEYDLLSRLNKKVLPTGGTYEMSYDENSNLKSIKDPSNNITYLEYDDENKLLRKVLPDDEFVFEYDNYDNLIKLSNSTSTLQYTYTKIDGKDRIISSTLTGKGDLENYPIINHEYIRNEFGDRTALVTNLGRFDFHFDATDRLIGVTGFDGKNHTYEYNSVSRLSKINGPFNTIEYEGNNTGSLTKINYKKDSFSLAEFSYAYKPNGLVGSVSGYINASYSYDVDGQLTSVSSSASETFEYDNLGNRTSDIYGSYIYEPKNLRLMEDYKYIYVYDPNGNLSSRQEKGFNGNITNYTYNSQNQLIGVEEFVDNIKVSSARYWYDVIGRRLRKTVDTQVKNIIRNYEYDGQEIIAVYDEVDRLSTYTHSYLKTDDPLRVQYSSRAASLGLAPSEGDYFFVKDRLGTIYEIRNSSGNLIQKFDYNSFGKILAITNGAGLDVTENPVVEVHFSYTGREYDSESGLYYYRARYYDPSKGRFLQQDPKPGSVGLPETVHNLYAYVGNNPLNFLDPSGMSWWEDWGRDLVIDIAIAVAVVVLITYGTPVTAAAAWAAVGSVAGGAAVAAATLATVSSLVTGDWNSWDSNFAKAFHTNFRIGMAALAVGAVAARGFGGGISSAGGNGLNGYVSSKEQMSVTLFGESYSISGGITMGTGTVYSGSGSYDAIHAHEFGHTLQFIGLSAVGGLMPANASNEATWAIYLFMGMFGVVNNESGPGGWWENMAGKI